MKFGVFDIGTRATRLLVADGDTLLERGFRFDDCKNFGDKTEAGRAIKPIDEHTAILQVSGLEKTISYLRNLVKEARQRGVEPENMHAVGTEVFRRVANWQEIVQLIEVHAGVRIKVLHPVEEADTTFWAARISCASMYEHDEPFIVIEQGGGSTQLTAASVDEGENVSRFGQTSIARLGTVLLREEFLEHQRHGGGGGERLVRTVKRDVLSFAQEMLTEQLAAKFRFPADRRPARAFALGTVITNAWGKKVKNSQVHGREATIDFLLRDPAADSVLDRYSNYRVSSLLKDASSPDERSRIEDLLVESFGLPCYAAVLQHFGLDRLQVCGTGLRYGVFFRLAYGEWQNIREYQG